MGRLALVGIANTASAKLMASLGIIMIFDVSKSATRARCFPHESISRSDEQSHQFVAEFFW
jgi:hypothetical protein